MKREHVECKMEEVDDIDSGLFLEFASHDKAFKALLDIGFNNICADASFTSCTLVEKLNELLETDGIVGLDMTQSIPDTSNAAYKALALAALHSSLICGKDKNTLCVMLRTKLNTPSMLFGSHWQDLQALGKKEADRRVVYRDTPGIFLFFGDRVLCFPSSVLKADVEIVAKILAQSATGKNEYCCCEICGTPFAKHGDDGMVVLSEMAVSTDKRMFLRSCIHTPNHGQTR